MITERNLPFSVKSILDRFSQLAGYLSRNDVKTLMDFGAKSEEHTDFLIDYCSKLISTVKKSYRTTYLDDIYYVRGLMYETKKDYDKAIKDFSVAVKMFNDANGALFERGKVFYLSGKYEDALRDLNKVISRDSSNGDYFYYRGLTYQAMGDTIKGMQDLKTALQYAKE